MRYSAGRLLNHLSRCASAPAMTPAADALFPATYLYDAKASRAARFGSLVTDSRIGVDLNLLAGGDGEAADAASGWTVEAGTLTRDVGVKNAGAASLKLTHTSAAAFYRDVLARAGEQARVPALAAYGGGGAVAARITVQDLLTGKYLGLDGTWTAGVQYLANRTAASWASSAAFTATLESLAAHVGEVETTLRWRCELSASGTVYFDDMGLWPLTDFAALVGHTIPPRLTPKLYSSTTGAFAGEQVLEATFAPLRGQMYVALPAACSSRYLRIVLEGTPVTAPGIGEAILTQGRPLTRAPQAGLQVQARERQARFETGLGGTEVYLDGSGAPEQVTASWLCDSAAAWSEIRDELYTVTRGGAYPLLLWGLDALGTGRFVYGRLGAELPQLLQERLADGASLWKMDVEITPEPWPLA